MAASRSAPGTPATPVGFDSTADLLRDGGIESGGGPKVRRFVTTSKGLPLPGTINKFLKMSEKELEVVITEESERFKVCA